MEKLPDELLLMIADYLWEHTLRPLVKVCRRWSSVFFQPANSSIITGETNIIPFVQTVHRYPHIAPGVKQLWMGFTGSSKTRHPPDITPVQKMLKSITSSEEEYSEWKRNLERGSVDAWMGCLLPVLDNLSVIEIYEYPSWEGYLRRVSYYGYYHVCLLLLLKQHFASTPDLHTNNINSYSLHPIQSNTTIHQFLGIAQQIPIHLQHATSPPEEDCLYLNVFALHQLQDKTKLANN
ncbi:hypothetical protein BDV25DRAFT_135828 [Aspergillus avenaceus]|uniref:F-box domain-containing protein n=1 Tax=Aspergillus avenaceus TaxID=36643 RepID=A0A5N6U720_ASPAV|nr:hypothetical protein BDV25DRAFT_135828 [Aspergillus avenaceus]